MGFWKNLTILLVPLLPAIWLYTLRESSSWNKTIWISGSEIQLWRDPTGSGVIHFSGYGDEDFAKGLGYAHAKDRMTQMILQRTASEGRLSELLSDTPETRAIDIRFRKMGFERIAKKLMGQLGGRKVRFLKAYSEGVNTYIKENKSLMSFIGQSLELTLLGITKIKWRPADCLKTAAVFSFMGLTGLQEDMENLVLALLTAEEAQGGGGLARLQELFRPHLDEVTEELVALLRRTARNGTAAWAKAVPEGLWAPAAFKASNNWAVRGDRAAGGGALLAGDPHLEVARLPPAFAEFVYHDAAPTGCKEGGGSYATGLALPGYPALIFGRTRHVGWMITFGCMDQIDTFVEEVKNGKSRDGSDGQWTSLKNRTEILKTKSGERVSLTFFETRNGILDRGDETNPDIEDGIYLSRAWSWQKLMRPEHFDNWLMQPRYCNVSEGMAAVRPLPVGANFVFADRAGNIGYQQTGLLPDRGDRSGLAPALGWDPAARWRPAPASDTPASLLAAENPAEGYLVTANQHLRAPGPGAPLVTNAHAGRDRTERISELLEDALADGRKITIDDFKAIQADALDPTARRYLARLAPLLPGEAACPGARAAALRGWDYRYTYGSKGAAVFQEMYQELCRRAFGSIFGYNGINALFKDFPIGFLSWRFDELLLGEPEIAKKWLNGSTLEAVLLQITSDIVCTSQENKADSKDGFVDGLYQQPEIFMKNIFFQGKLPRALGVRLLGLDRGPVPLLGSTNTVVQGRAKRLKGGGLQIPKLFWVDGAAHEEFVSRPVHSNRVDGAAHQLLQIPKLFWVDGVAHEEFVSRPVHSNRVDGAAHQLIGALGPVWRGLADMGQPELLTALAGGQSGRFLSQFYTSDYDRFWKFEYKTIDPYSSPTPSQQKKNKKKRGGSKKNK